eukprot:8684240-Heterocapsa_arctica.AAC.1
MSMPRGHSRCSSLLRDDHLLGSPRVELVPDGYSPVTLREGVQDRRPSDGSLGQGVTQHVARVDAVQD